MTKYLIKFTTAGHTDCYMQRGDTPKQARDLLREELIADLVTNCGLSKTAARKHIKIHWTKEG